MAAGRRLLLRAPKDTFEVVSPEETVGRNLIATNSGNLIFLGAAQKVLGAPGVELEMDGLRVQPSAAGEINERFDGYVIPLANAFRPGYEERLIQLTKLIRRLTIPVSILGVGADGTIDGDTARIQPMAGVVRDFVAAVLDRGPSIGVRGELTADFLGRLGFRDVEVIGCPSMFLDGPRLDVAKRTARLTREHHVVITISPYLSAMGPILQHHAARYPNLAYVAQDLGTLEMLVLGTPVAGAARTRRSRGIRTIRWSATGGRGSTSTPGRGSPTFAGSISCSAPGSTGRSRRCWRARRPISWRTMREPLSWRVTSTSRTRPCATRRQMRTRQSCTTSRTSVPWCEGTRRASIGLRGTSPRTAWSMPSTTPARPRRSTGEWPPRRTHRPSRRRPPHASALEVACGVSRRAFAPGCDCA